MTSLVPLFALALPIILLPLELIFPYPHVIEEIAKTALVLLILDLKSAKEKLIYAVLIGTLFTFSESVLYLFNIYLIGDLNTFLLRLLYTAPLHILTSILILIPTFINKKLIVLGVVMAVIIHYAFNFILSAI